MLHLDFELKQEFRPYGLALFLFVLSLWLFEPMADSFSRGRLSMLYAVMLATWYTSYLAAVAQLAMLVYLLFEKVWQKHPQARRLLHWTPVYGLGLVIGYIPWILPVLTRASAMGKKGMGHYSFDNILSILQFFAFGHQEYQPISPASVVFWFMVVGGCVLALLSPRDRFIGSWMILVPGAVLLLQTASPQFPVARYFLMAVPAILGCAAVLIAWIWRMPRGHVPAVVLTIFILGFQTWTLTDYYQSGRPDWRSVAAWVRWQWHPGERVFTQNGELYFPVAYYLNGAEQLLNHGGIPTYDLKGNPYPLNWAWKDSRNGQLVIYESAPASLWHWTRDYPKRQFPLEMIHVIRLPQGKNPPSIPRRQD